MKKILCLLIFLIAILTTTSCGNTATPPQSKNNTTPAPTPVVNTLGISPEIFFDRWNKNATITELPDIRMTEVPGMGGTDKTTYTFSKNNTMTVNIDKNQGKVKSVLLQTNILKINEAESEILGGMYYHIIYTVEPNLTGQEMDKATDNLINNWEPGKETTVTVGKTKFQQKVGISGGLELLIENVND